MEEIVGTILEKSLIYLWKSDRSNKFFVNSQFNKSGSDSGLFQWKDPNSMFRKIISDPALFREYPLKEYVNHLHFTSIVLYYFALTFQFFSSSKYYIYLVCFRVGMENRMFTPVSALWRTTRNQLCTYLFH